MGNYIYVNVERTRASLFEVDGYEAIHKDEVFATEAWLMLMDSLYKSSPKAFDWFIREITGKNEDAYYEDEMNALFELLLSPNELADREKASEDLKAGDILFFPSGTEIVYTETESRLFHTDSRWIVKHIDYDNVSLESEDRTIQFWIYKCERLLRFKENK